MRCRLLWACCLGLAVAGCGGGENKPVTEDDMKATALGDVGQLYRGFQVLKNKPPKKLADLAPLEPEAPTGFQAIKSGDVVVRYGATLTDTGEVPGQGEGDEVLAYEKQVPESGGQVLMINRAIKTMTPDEFKAAKLAGDASSADEAASKKGKK